jgi:hypothetical protein
MQQYFLLFEHDGSQVPTFVTLLVYYKVDDNA